MKRLCVFCGSSMGERDSYRDNARELGLILAQRNIELIYGAGNCGLMGVLANAVLSHGGRVTGVIPRELLDREVAHNRLSELHVVNGMHERKALMTKRAEGFLALPGGLGTLDELFEILTWAQLGLHKKPIALLNVDGFLTRSLYYWNGRSGKGLYRQTIEIFGSASVPH